MSAHRVAMIRPHAYTPLVLQQAFDWWPRVVEGRRRLGRVPHRRRVTCVEVRRRLLITFAPQPSTWRERHGELIVLCKFGNSTGMSDSRYFDRPLPGIVDP